MKNPSLSSRCIPVLLTLALFGTSFAHEHPVSGLGQAWPNTTDSSRNPHFHAYVFMIDGIKYVQINDANGNVLGAVGSANGEFITLPVGRFAHQVRTPKQAPVIAPTAKPSAEAVTVYQDADTQVDVMPLSDGTLELSISAFCSNAFECNSGFL